MTKLRDKFWLWGQSPNSHYGYGFGDSRMSAVEGCVYFDIDRCCRVAMRGNPAPPFDQESMAMDTLKEVVWSIVGAGGMENHNNGKGDLDEVIRQATLFPNITGGVFDDFFTSEQRRNAFTPEIIKEIRAKLRDKSGRPLDLWVVVYENNLDLPIQNHLDACDVITFWTWRNQQNLQDAEKNFDRLVAMTPGKKHLNGCYLYDYGNHLEMPMDLMKQQCKLYEKLMLSGRSDGLILCSNCCADVGLSTVPYTRAWLKEIGSEVVS